MLEATRLNQLTMLRFGKQSIRIKPEFVPAEINAMKILSAEVKDRLSQLHPSLKTQPNRLDAVSQWASQVMATIVSLNNRLKSEGPLQSFMRKIEEFFADRLGISMADHSLSPEEEQFLKLIPKLTSPESEDVRQQAAKDLVDLYDVEHDEDSTT